jgi:hypothetical protein
LCFKSGFVSLVFIAQESSYIFMLAPRVILVHLGKARESFGNVLF